MSINQSANPRIAAGMSVAEWTRARKLRRRNEWETRLVARRAAINVTSLEAARTPIEPTPSKPPKEWRP